MTICQLQNLTKSTLLATFSLILFAGCSHTPVSDSKEDDRVIKAQWFKLPLRFSHRDSKDDGFITHPFFDIDPLIGNFKNKQPDNYGIRYVVSTPVDSKFQYELDLYSGKLFREREYCAQDDIWKNYSADLMEPNFTQGIVPRTYDENDNPMRIVVISSKKFIEPFKENPTHFDEARIVGSLVVDHCENFPCDMKSRWKTAQILFGVSTRDPVYNAMSSFSDLKSKIDWEYARAFLTNMYGHHKIGGKAYPAYRISKELNLKDSFEYFEKSAKKISVNDFTELNKWRLGCMKLYDSIWEDSEKIRKLTYGQQDAFLKLFQEFYAKNSNEFYLCQQRVRPANIVENHRRLWFFSYLQAFTILVKNGFYYSCQQKAWALNPRVDENKFYYDQNKELASCRAKNFQTSFDQAINGMSLMRNQLNRQYRFVEYDNMRGGSHQKIYGWIHGRGHNYACKNESNSAKQISFEIFPQDVVWEYFKPDEDGLVK